VMRTIDIDTTGKTWRYRPGSDQGPHGAHKTAWRGHDRVVILGPRAQELLRPWLRLNLHENLFQPRDGVADFRGRQRAARKTKVQPSQADRRKSRPKRRPRTYYTTSAYAAAVGKAVLAANTARACEPCKMLQPAKRCQACRATEVPHWHPNRLRHTTATKLRKEFGIDAARAVLGHRSPAVTEVYAELDVGKAAEVMERLG
jgi:integrase